MSKHFLFAALMLLLLAGMGCILTAPLPSATDTPTVAAPISDEEALEAMQVIGERVSELRGLETLHPVTQTLLTTDELRQKIEQEVMADYTEQEAHDDVLKYVAFELLEQDVDLHQVLVDLQTEQVAGYYDPDTQEMYVVKTSGRPGALERATYAHEYVHVLQDQHFDLEALGFTDDDEEQDRDNEQQFAIRCLVEGDASLLQQQYTMGYFKPEDLSELLKQVNAVGTEKLDAAPPVIRESLLFPYEAGMAFVSQLYAKGGWEAVDAAYETLPLSSEQIMHPERYPDDVPQVITLPPLTDTLGPGWRLVDEDVMGEFDLLLYLDGRLDRSEAETAAEGWGGGRYAVHWREDESGFVLVLRLAWDTPTDAAEFWHAYAQFARDRFGADPTRADGDARWWWLGEDALLLAQNEQDETLVIIAPDEAILNAVRSLFPEF